MKILIIKLAAIGDVLRTTSILAGLRDKYSLPQIDWLTTTAAKEVLLYNQFIDNLWVWEELPEFGDYDLVINLEDGREVAELEVKSSRVIGAYLEDDRITYSPSAWFDMSAISKYGIEKANELKRLNRKTFQEHMARLLQIPVSQYVFNLTGDEIEYGRRVLSDLGVSRRDRVVGINTGAGQRWSFKSLSIEKTIDLIKALERKLGLVSLILGGEGERERNQIISKESGMPNGGVHSLRRFAGVVGQCEVLVCSDSLAFHFAIALKRKVVAFFGPTSPTEIELYGLGEKVFPKIDCLVCYRRECDKKNNCMGILSVDELVSAVKRQLL